MCRVTTDQCQSQISLTAVAYPGIKNRVVKTLQGPDGNGV